MSTNRTPHEAAEMTWLFQWIGYASAVHPELWLAFHIPNEGLRDPRTGHNLKIQGMRPGVPDIMLPVARGIYHGLFIELKRKKYGRVSEEQAIWIDRLNRVGYRAVVCAGWEAAKGEILRYLGAES